MNAPGRSGIEVPLTVGAGVKDLARGQNQTRLGIRTAGLRRIILDYCLIIIPEDGIIRIPLLIILPGDLER